MATTKEYINIFDGGIDFAVHSINEQCMTEFKSLADVIAGIRAMKQEAGARGPMFSQDNYCLGDERYHAND